MSLLIEALKRAEQAKREQDSLNEGEIAQETSLTFETTEEPFLLDQTEEKSAFLLNEKNEPFLEESLLLDDFPNDEFLLPDNKDNDIKFSEETNSYNAEWLPLDLDSLEIKSKEPLLKKPPPQPIIEEIIAPKPTVSPLNIEDTFSKPWTKEEQTAAAAELQAAHSSISLKPLFGYLALLVVMIGILGGGYFFISQKAEELGKSSFATSQVTPLPAGGLAAKLAEIQKKSQQEQTVTQPQTVITQIPKVEEKPLVKTPTVPIKTEHNQQVANTSQTPTQPSSPPQNPQTTQATKRLKIEHNSANRQVDNRLLDAYQAYQQGNYAKAKKLYVAVLQEDKHSRDALLGLAAISVQNQQVNQAKQYYQQVLRFYPKDAVAEMGLINLQDGDIPESENTLKNQLNQQPESSHLQFVLGNFYSRQHRWGEAQQAYFEAYRRDNQHPDYAYNLAVSLDQLGKSQAALPYYQRALTLSANHKANFDSQTVQQRISELEKP
jgi:Tfp pilus assembly protein PilF